MKTLIYSILILTLSTALYSQGGLVETQNIGTGDGHTATFTGTLNDLPVKSSFVVVRCGMVSGHDRDTPNVIDGHGITGTINYTTGAISVTFTAPPVKNAVVRASWRKELHP